ncbi:MAG: 16S rRNA (adenine(1518)-N(6)/adenine(1519)-N(6))-dimethyltransferase RsmA [Actinobacteria bacterium]|nr:16S rRNA (adenine(1518)-N(6)/adenine(1519)-N(6))-dimethyltransferase RsmA [Actinomycetota bacterium]
MLTATDIRELLRRHGLAPSRRLGQHFVVDHNTLRRMVADAGVQPGDHVCEIGAGLGSLTVALRDAGARVTAIEVDAGLVRALTEVVGDDPLVRVLHADVRDVDLAAAVEAPAMVVANLPYAIGTSITLDVLALEHFARAHIMVQREVGQRMRARVGDPQFGAVSVKIAAYADTRITANVSRQAFFPVPGVDSVTVALQPRTWPCPVPRRAVLALVGQGFRQRRKRLRNALAPLVAPPAFDAAARALGLSPDVRAEQLTLSTWCELAEALRERRVAGDASIPVR